MSRGPGGEFGDNHDLVFGVFASAHEEDHIRMPQLSIDEKPNQGGEGERARM